MMNDEIPFIILYTDYEFQGRAGSKEIFGATKHESFAHNNSLDRTCGRVFRKMNGGAKVE